MEEKKKRTKRDISLNLKTTSNAIFRCEAFKTSSFTIYLHGSLVLWLYWGALEGLREILLAARWCGLHFRLCFYDRILPIILLLDSRHLQHLELVLSLNVCSSWSLTIPQTFFHRICMACMSLVTDPMTAQHLLMPRTTAILSLSGPAPVQVTILTSSLPGGSCVPCGCFTLILSCIYCWLWW